MHGQDAPSAPEPRSAQACLPIRFRRHICACLLQLAECLADRAQVVAADPIDLELGDLHLQLVKTAIAADSVEDGLAEPSRIGPMLLPSCAQSLQGPYHSVSFLLGWKHFTRHCMAVRPRKCASKLVRHSARRLCRAPRRGAMAEHEPRGGWPIAAVSSQIFCIWITSTNFSASTAKPKSKKPNAGESVLCIS